jgi:hypothetical protein
MTKTPTMKPTAIHVTASTKGPMARAHSMRRGRKVTEINIVTVAERLAPVIIRSHLKAFFIIAILLTS